jgi:hypothetical protein
MSWFVTAETWKNRRFKGRNLRYVLAAFHVVVRYRQNLEGPQAGRNLRYVLYRRIGAQQIAWNFQRF